MFTEPSPPFSVNGQIASASEMVDAIATDTSLPMEPSKVLPRVRTKSGSMDHPATQPRGTHRKSQPKKGGAGGKGTWGKAGEQMTVPKVQEADPNFDQEENITWQVADLDLTTREIDMMVQPALLEYMENGDAEEVVMLCRKLNLGANKHHLVDMTVRLGMDRNNYARELASKLLASLSSSNVVGDEDFKVAFHALLDNLYDLKLDAPDASDALAKFVARAVADECVPPAFVLAHPAASGDFPNPIVRACMHKARTLLTLKSGMARLDKVWGVHGQCEPVEDIITAMVLIIKEYVDSEDAGEAERGLKDLGVPHFHHHFVYEAVYAVLDSNGNHRTSNQISRLLAYFVQAAIITHDQLNMGLRRLFTGLADIQLDIPRAKPLLQDFLMCGLREQYLSRSLLAEFPMRQQARRRYVSENEGGRVRSTVS